MSTSVIEKWCTRMKVRKKDTVVIIKVQKCIDKARKQLKDSIKDNYKLYRIISDYPVELKVIVYSWGLDYKKNIRKYFTRLSAINLDINGRDLKNMGYEPSYKFREVLEEVFAMRLNGKIPGRESQLQKAKELMESMK